MRTPMPLTPGDPAPWFTQHCTSRSDYRFDTVAGRIIVLCFFGSAGEAPIRAMLDGVRSRRDVFDDAHAAFFGVSADPGDEAESRISETLPGFRLFWDFDLAVARLYGLVRLASGGRSPRVQPTTFVLDAALRIAAVLPQADPLRHVEDIVAAVEAVRRVDAIETQAHAAPVLFVPRIFEPELCRRLIDLYERDGGLDSGFMQDRAGKTVSVLDHQVKRRRDRTVEDEALRQAIRTRVERRLNPQIRRAFCFSPTRIERYLVACYDAREGGYFRAHRDNTTKGTAHRRFAVTINLNSEDYDGGDLRFPEYGMRTYRAPTGGAIVFSCSLMHEATAVTRGRRFAFLPFLYDDAAAWVRAENLEHIGDEKVRESLRAALA